MKVFIDLGAYDGDTIEKAMKLFPDMDYYYGFEPYSANFNALQKKLGKDKRVKLYKVAVGVKTGKQRLYSLSYKYFALHGKQVGASLIKEKSNINNDTYSIVKVINFSKFLKYTFKKDDLIILKVDIEGMEYELLNHLIETGMIEYINEIYCEWHHHKMPSYDDIHKQTIEKLQKLGYNLTGNNKQD